MTLATYDPASSMLDARGRYFEVNRFGPNGGYDEAWVDFKIGPVPMPFPNTPGRVAAVKVHDLHHIVTGYDTDLAGELEIAGFEIGAGCGDFLAAWVINLAGLGLGAFVYPSRVFRAYVRGRRSESLYGRDLDAMLASTVADARAAMRVDGADRIRPSAFDRLAFGALAAVGTLVGLAFFAVAAPLMPFGVVALSMAKPKGRPENS